MINQILKPDGFEHLNDDGTWIWMEFHDGKNAIGNMGLQIQNGHAGVHYRSIRWSHNTAKILRKDWKIILETLKEYGIKDITATHLDINDKKWPKFIKIFGFPEPKPMNVSIMEL